MKLVTYIFIALLLIIIFFEAIQLFGSENIKSLHLTNNNSIINPTVISNPSPTSPILILSPAITQPSDRALKAAAYVYISSDDKGKKIWDDKMLSTGSARLTINKMAQRLDEDITMLITFETAIEQEKANKSRPIINYDPPDIKYQPPDINIQNPPDIYKPLSCTSTKNGDYTYTNCY